MSILGIEYRGGIRVEDYKLVDHGDGNGFGLVSEHCTIINDAEANVHEGLIELTLYTASMGSGLSLGDADRVVLTAEDAEDLIQTLQDALEDADEQQYEFRQRNEAKVNKVCANMNKTK